MSFLKGSKNLFTFAIINFLFIAVFSVIIINTNAIGDGFKNITSAINQWQGNIFPDRQENDDVPLRFQKSAGTFETTIYSTKQEAELKKFSETILWGVMAEIQKARKNFIGFLIIIASGLFASLYFDCRKKSKESLFLAITMISTLSIFMSLRLSNGWDELFINLRHAYMLLNNGTYSVNAGSLIEGTVDFIPLIVTAILGAVGLSLVDGFIIVSLLGNIFVIVFSYLIIEAITKNRMWALLSALLVGVYPNVIWIGGTGFSAVLFSGWILAASYYILFAEKRVLGLILLSLLTLVRTEGILLAFLLMAYVYVIAPLPDLIRTKQWKTALIQAIKDGFLVAAPFLLSLVVRKIVYGHMIPNPISFKNTGFDAGFLSVGISSFADMILTHQIHIMIVMIVCLYILCMCLCKVGDAQAKFKKNAHKLGILCIITFLFILPYYSGGGDWFPSKWNRYGLPFNLSVLLLFSALLYGAYYFGLKSWMRPAGLMLCSIILSIGYVYANDTAQQNVFKHTLGELYHHNPHRWFRIDNLISLGYFLRNNVDENATVSSPEEATIMYFSERDMLGLLGVSTPDVSAMPFQPKSPGDIMHRKRAYKAVFDYRPDVIALYEPAVRGEFFDKLDLELMESVSLVLDEKIFDQVMVDVAYYRVGSYGALHEMGYRHVTLIYPDRIFSLFVNKSIYDNFVQNIQKNKFRYFGTHSIKYSVSDDLTKKYKPAVDEIIVKL